MSKKYNFDITVTDNTYAGELALPYVTAAVTGAETIANNRARLIEGVVHKAVVSNLNITDPIQAAACAGTDGANTSLTEQVLTLNDLMVKETICRGTLFPTFIAAQGRMRRDGQIPPDFAEFLLATVADKTGENLESLMWAGDAGAVWGLGLLSNDGVIDEAGIDASAMADFTEAVTDANLRCNQHPRKHGYGLRWCSRYPWHPRQGGRRFLPLLRGIRLHAAGYRRTGYRPRLQP